MHLGSSLFIFLNRFFNNIASLLVMFFYAHQLAVTDYGHYQAFWTQLNIFNALAGLGISIFSLTYSTEKLRAFIKRIKTKYYFSYFVFLLFCGVGFAIFQFDNTIHFSWALLFLAGFALCNISDALLIAFRRFRFLVGVNVVYALLFFSIHYFVLVHGFDLNLLLVFLLPLLFLKLLISSWVLYQRKPLDKDKDLEHIGNEEQKRMATLWQHLYFYDIIQISSLWLDKFLISVFMDSKETAIYINGTLSIPFLPIFFSAIISGALIHLSANRDSANQLNTVNYIGRILSAVAFPVCIFLIVFRTEFITFAFSDKYLTSVPIFLCATLIIPFRAYGHTVILQNLEKGKIINQGAILDVVVALVLMYPLYLFMGLPGVALSFVLSTLVQVIFYCFHTGRFLQAGISDLFPLKNWGGKIVVFSLLAWGLYRYLPLYWTDTSRMFVAGGIMAVLALLVLYKEWKSPRAI